MDQRIRIATATIVMLVGLGLALCFRRPFSDTEPPLPPHGEQLVLRKQPDTSATLVPVTPAGHFSAEATEVASTATPEPQRNSPVVVAPSEQCSAPPEISPKYPQADRVAASRWGVSLGERLPEAAASQPSKHKVADGDSLALLAERYLGSAQKASDIFEANRNILTRPELLPIGVELKIPRADPSADAAK